MKLHAIVFILPNFSSNFVLIGIAGSEKNAFDRHIVLKLKFSKMKFKIFKPQYSDKKIIRG